MRERVRGWVLDLLSPNLPLTLNPTQGRAGGGGGGNSPIPKGIARVKFKKTKFYPIK